MENLKDKIVHLLLDSSQQYGDTYEQRCIYDSDFNEVAKCVVNIVMKTPSDALLSEIMVLRERNAELVEMLKKVIVINNHHGFNGHCINKQIESLINLNIKE